MPRYYFDLHEGDQVFLDEYGEELRDGEVARQRALQCAGELLRDYPSLTDGENFVIEVREAGKSVLRVTARVRVENLE